MGWMLYDFDCPICGHEVVDELLKSEEVSREDANGERYTKKCPECGEEMERRFPAPHLRTDNNSASYVDGTKRKGFAEGKIAAELECLKVQTKDGEEKGRIQQEIKKTGVSLS